MNVIWLRSTPQDFLKVPYESARVRQECKWRGQAWSLAERDSACLRAAAPVLTALKKRGPEAPRRSSAKGQLERKVEKRSLAEVEPNVIPLRISPTACSSEL